MPILLFLLFTVGFIGLALSFYYAAMMYKNIRPGMDFRLNLFPLWLLSPDSYTAEGQSYLTRFYRTFVPSIIVVGFLFLYSWA